MSYAPCRRSSTGATPQSLPHPAAALFVAFASSAEARRGMRHLLAPGLSLCEAGAAPQPSRSGQPAQDRLHREVAHHAGPPAASPCRAHRTHLERSRQPGPDCDARPRAEAWLKRGHPGRRGRFISNIISTVCSLPDSHKRTNCWCLTNGGPSANLRR